MEKEIDYNEQTVSEIVENVNKEVYNMLINKEINFVTSEEDYWKQHKIYKKRISKLVRNFYKYIKKPYDFLYEFEKVLVEMIYVGVVNEEWAQGQRERLYREMQKPDEFKEWVENAKNRILKRQQK